MVVLATQVWQPLFRSRTYGNVEGTNKLHKVVLCLIHAYPQAHSNKYMHCIYTQKLCPGTLLGVCASTLAEHGWNWE